MKRYITLILSFGISLLLVYSSLTSCVPQSKYDTALQRLDSLSLEVTSEQEANLLLKSQILVLRDSVQLLSFPANQRYDYVTSLIKIDSLDLALKEIDNLKRIFPKSKEAQMSDVQISRIEKKKEDIKAEKERIKASGFKYFNDKSVVWRKNNSGEDIKYTFSNFHFDNKFSFNYIDDIDEYYYKTANKGNTYILANLSVYTKANYASAPSLYACKIVDGKLSVVALFIDEYASYSTYGAYLGNYSEDSHDFSKVNTVRYNIAAQISLEESNLPLVVILNKTSEKVEGMSIEEVAKKCEVIRIINRNKL